MKVFDLRCAEDHRFEGWFASANDYARQKKRRLIACPTCGGTEVKRVPSATRFSVTTAPAPRPEPARPAGQEEGKARDPLALAQILSSKMVDEMLTKSEDVGTRFPAEARKIHNDEAPKRSIRGQATQEEFEALVDEGVEVARLPIPPSSKWN